MALGLQMVSMSLGNVPHFSSISRKEREREAKRKNERTNDMAVDQVFIN